MAWEIKINSKLMMCILQLMLVSGAVVFAFFPTLQSLGNAWAQSDDYSHGFFIVPVALYIAGGKRKQLVDLPIRPSAFSGFLLLFSLLLYIFSCYAEIATASNVTMVVSFFCLVFFLTGWLHLKELIFPLTLLFFMIPVPEQIYSSITVPLQLVVSQASVFIAQIMDIPIYREGNVIYLPNNTLEVVQACSGLRSLMSLITLSLIMSYFFLKNNALRAAMLMASLPVAILVNILRVLLMIIVIHYFQYDLTDDSVHSWYGLVAFLFALLLLFGTERVLSIWDS